MKIIEDFLAQYNKEFDFYQKLCQIIASKIEDQLFKRGIKAIVTNRAKRPDRLRDKLIKRNEDKKYKEVKEIYDDIVDLAGIRVSLYFPSEREIIDELINDLFNVNNKKIFPSASHVPKYDKRFSGYWATHYRVKLKEENSTKRYADSVAEIQVASVLMHAWLYLTVEKPTKFQFKSIPPSVGNNPVSLHPKRDDKTCWTWKSITRSYYYILERV